MRLHRNCITCEVRFIPTTKGHRVCFPCAEIGHKTRIKKMIKTKIRAGLIEPHKCAFCAKRFRLNASLRIHTTKCIKRKF